MKMAGWGVYCVSCVCTITLLNHVCMCMSMYVYVSLYCFYSSGALFFSDLFLFNLFHSISVFSNRR